MIATPLNGRDLRLPYALDDAPWPLKQPTEPTSNNAFLLSVLRNRTPQTYPWVTSFREKVEAAGRGEWRGNHVRTTDVGTFPPSDVPEDTHSNNYWVVSSFHSDADGRIARSVRQHASTCVLLLDDIGAGIGGKIPWARLNGWPPPSFVIETSPKSYQVGYILSPAVTDTAFMDWAIRETIYVGLGADKDPGMVSVTRYGRLPNGVNNKQKYLDPATGEYPRCRLVHWAPEVTYDLNLLLFVIGIDSAAGYRASLAKQSYAAWVDPTEDPYVEAIGAAGLILGRPRDKGGTERWIDVRCPWAEEHGPGREDDGAAYLIGGGFKCHHGHCETRGFQDLRSWLIAGKGGDDARGIASRALARELLGDDWASDLAAWERKKEQGAAPLQEQWSYRAEEIEKAAAEPAWSYQQIVDAIETLPHADDPASIERQGEVIHAIGRLQMSGREFEYIVSRLAGAIGCSKSALRKDIAQTKKEMRRAGVKAIVVAAEGESPGQESIIAGDIIGGTLARGSDPAARAKRARALLGHGDGRGVISTRISADGDSEQILIAPDNVVAILQHSCGNVLPNIQYNLLTKMIEVVSRGQDGSLTVEEATDGHIVDMLQMVTRDYGVNIPKAMFTDALKMLAQMSGYHPVEQYLLSLKHDGVSRLDTWLSDVLGERPSLYNRAVGRMWILGASARALKPGIKFDYIPILSGPEDYYKSTLIEKVAMSRDWYSEVGLDMKKEKDTIEKLHCAWQVEVGELSGFFGAEAEEMKMFISRTHDVFRRPYSLLPERNARRFIMVGTTNRDRFAASQYGNRRLLPITVTRNLQIDVLTPEYLAELYAEAVLEVRAGWRAIFTNEEKMAIRVRQQAAELKDAADDDVLDALDRIREEDIERAIAECNLKGLPAEDVASLVGSINLDVIGVERFRLALGIDPAAYRGAEGRKIMRIMERLGYSRSRRRDKSSERRYVWVKTGSGADVN